MRVSNSMLYDSIVSRLQQSTGKLQELYEQASTQKRVNRPSDDPVGMARILNSRDAIKAFERYQANVDTAKGWLGTADTTLMEVQDILARMKELSVQAANGTMSADNRQAIALEVRQNFQQLVSLANTRYEGKSLFAGHKVDGPAFTQGLQVSSNTADAVPFVRSVSGSSDRTIQVRFEPDDATVPPLGKAIIGDEEVHYRYSTDGGRSWKQETLSDGETSLDLDGVQVDLREGYEVVSSGERTLDVADPDVVVDPSVDATASGFFKEEVRVRFDKNVDLDDSSQTVSFSVSTDGGETFKGGYTAEIETAEATLNLGEGRQLRLESLAAAGTEDILIGDEIVIPASTELQAAPTAIYQGDDRNTPAAEIEQNFGVRVTPLQGSFDSDVQVRIDGVSGGNIHYSYSHDGGDSWEALRVADPGYPADSVVLELPGGRVRLEDASGGTGDLEDPEDLQFTLHGTSVRQMSTDVHAHAMGDLSENVLVRIDGRDDDSNPNNPPDDSSFDLGGGGDPIQYSYSLDGGDTWVEGNTASNPASSGEYAELPVPGGMLKLAPPAEDDGDPINNTLEANDQFLIQPRNAVIDTEVHQGMELAMNTPGVEVFGGHYQNESGLEPAFEEDKERNLFLGLGKLIAGLETNDQEQIQASLSSINGAIDQVSRMQADIGARENRLEVSEKVLSDLELNEEERKSRVEDVDFAELMSRIKQRQTVYQAVMKTSAMVMRMSLMDYL